MVSQRKIEVVSTVDRNAIVEKNQRLIYSVMRRCFKLRPDQYADAFQEGAIGLMRAAEQFDPEDGGTFATFAWWKIRGAISSWLRSLTAYEKCLTSHEIQAGKVGKRESLHRPLHSEDDDQTLGDSIEGSVPTPERVMEDKRYLDDVAKRVKATEREVRILERLIIDDDLTQVEFAAKLGITRETLRVSEARLKTKLEQFFGSR